MAEISYVSEESFQDDVLRAEQPVIVDFTAAWCGPCKMLEPILKQLAQDWQGKVRVFKLDVDECPDLTARFQVMGVPTLMLFVGGQIVGRLVGYQPKNKIVENFSPYL